MRQRYKLSAVVKRFPQKGGWYYVSTGMTYDDLMIDTPKWGLVPAKFMIGQTVWEKSLLPYGDGTLFIALSKKIRVAEDIELGDEVDVEFELLGF